jgi:hypothetical protein
VNLAAATLVAAAMAASTSAARAAEVLLNPIQDATLIQDETSYANGAGPSVFAGAIASGGARRALLKFDLSGIPQGAVIHGVELYFDINRAAVGSGNSDPASLHRITASWGEGTSFSTRGGGDVASPNDATWTHRFYGVGGVGAGAVPWSVPGGDFVAQASSFTTVGGIGPYFFPSTVKLIEDVDGWLANPASNHGWLLLGPESASQTARRIHSRESATVASRPRLRVVYDTQAQVGDAPLPLWSLGLLGAGLLWGALRSKHAPA